MSAHVISSAYRRFRQDATKRSDRHMATVRWAVVGTSNFALDWIARGVTLGSNSELAAIVSRDRERGQAAAERTGAPHHYTSIDEIDTDAVDGVFIVTPKIGRAHV